MNVSVAVVTPTARRGGTDITYDSLNSQDYFDIDVWVVADELYEKRKDIMLKLGSQLPFEVSHFKPRKKPDGWVSDLAGIYNTMLGIAFDDYNVDLAVSIQDYMWVPSNGVRRFAESYLKHPDWLITGLMSYISGPEMDPVRSDVWSIFSFDWRGSPKGAEVTWRDVRIAQHDEEGDFPVIPPMEWELNWCAIPKAVWEEGVRFPEHYGAGISHENTAFACDAKLKGFETVIDMENEAFGLQHRDYFPDEERTKPEIRDINKDLFWNEYGNIYNVL